MISRLVLNLRSATELPLSDEMMLSRSMKFVARAIGDLGEELDTVLDASSEEFHGLGTKPNPLVDRDGQEEGL